MIGPEDSRHSLNQSHAHLTNTSHDLVSFSPVPLVLFFSLCWLLSFLLTSHCGYFSFFLRHSIQKCSMNKSHKCYIPFLQKSPRVFFKINYDTLFCLQICPHVAFFGGKGFQRTSSKTSTSLLLWH